MREEIMDKLKRFFESQGDDAPKTESNTDFVSLSKEALEGCL